MKLKPNLTKKELRRALKLADKELKIWAQFKVQVVKALWKLDK